MKTIKSVSVCFLAAIALLLLTSSGCTSSNQVPQEFDLVEPGVLTIGADASYPPHTFLDPKTLEIAGLDVDLAGEIARRLGLSVKFLPIEWKGIIPALQAKRFDLITAEMNITQERQQVVDFSDVVFTSGLVIVVRSTTSNIHSADDLAGKTVLVPIGTTEESEARKYTTKIKEYGLLSECFRELEIGRGDAVIVDLAVASEYTLKSENNLKIASPFLTKTESAFAFRKDPASAKLRSAINRILQQMQTDGTLRQIQSKWIAATAH